MTSTWDKDGDFPGPTLRQLQIRRLLKEWWEKVEQEHQDNLKNDITKRDEDAQKPSE